MSEDVSSFLGSELQQLITQNEKLFKKNQEFRDILRKVVLTVELEQVYSFDWADWAKAVRKVLK